MTYIEGTVRADTGAAAQDGEPPRVCTHGSGQFPSHGGAYKSATGSRERIRVFIVQTGPSGATRAATTASQH
ncbi:hypothetical protein DDE01_23160 [Desulfovibrio desulfuricans]|nr:hypothetical protein DDE01_23160 [Desulfovibrio desulfuricans]